MGVERTDYLMFGVDVGADAFDWEKHEAEAKRTPNARFDVVYDGMSGQYCVAGKIIAASDRYEGFIGRAEITPSDLDVDRTALAAGISEAFGRDVSPNDLKLILFSHFS